ncbi:hypothetical protein BC629DRAFT_1592504 [Irpex lacteus]|nr:hypothetical protein BC629DRAFT_1592504 [Irpex lacteus]
MTTVLSDEDEDAAPVGKSMSRRDRVLLAAPYAGFFICVLVILAVPDPNGHIIFREEGFLYCTIQSPATRIIPLLGASLMILALILDGIVMVRLWRMCKSYDELKMKRDFSMSIIVRVMLVSLCSFIALIALGMSILHDAVPVAPHMIQAILPTIAFIVFGTQTDLLEAWGLVRLWNRLRQFIRASFRVAVRQPTMCDGQPAVVYILRFTPLTLRLACSPSSFPHNSATNDMAGSVGEAYVFFVLQILGGHVGIPIILLTYSITGIRRHPLVENFLVTWVIYTTSLCLLLYTGNQFTFSTLQTICNIQASLIYGSTIMAAFSALAFIFNLWSCTRLVTQLKVGDEDLTTEKQAGRGSHLRIYQSAGHYVALSTEPSEDNAPISPTAETRLLTREDGIYETPHGGTFVYHGDGHYTYNYGPGGLAGLFHNYYALGCALFASIGGLLFGYDQGVIANVLVMKDFTERWPIGAWEKGLMTAMLELGCLLGAIITGTFADHFTRRQAIVSACTIFSLGSTFQFAAQSLPQIVIGRAIGGLGVGALSMLSPLYMAEISPPEVRGSLMALEQFSIVLGAVLGFWTGFFTREMPGGASWRIPLAIQIGPAVLLAVGSFLLPASPRLLVAHGRYTDALRALAKLRRRTPHEIDGDPLLQIELLEMRTEVLLIEKTTRSSVRDVGFAAELKAWSMLFTSKYIKRTMIGVLMMFFQQWSGINALLYYGPTLMAELGLQGDTITLMVSGGIGIVQFISVFPVILYIDRLGRKPLLRYGSATMCLAHLFIALLVWRYADSWVEHPYAAWTAVACTYIFTAGYGMSYGPIGWILPSEVFPISMRSRGVSLSTASNWLNNFLIGLLTPILIEFSASATFMVFSTACFLGYFWSTYIVPETGNVSLEEMDEVFGSSAAAEDNNLKHQIETDLGLHILIGGLVAQPPSHATS